MRAEMGQNRKAGGRSPGFVDSVVGVVEAIYDLIVQRLTPWTPKAPQLRTERGVIEDARPTEPVESRAEAEEALEEAIEAADAEAMESAQDDATGEAELPPGHDLVPAAPAWADAWAQSYAGPINGSGTNDG